MGKESFLGDIRYEETNMLSQPPGTMTATEGGYIRKVASAQSLETVLKSDYLAIVAERDSLAEQVVELSAKGKDLADLARCYRESLERKNKEAAEAREDVGLSMARASMLSDTDRLVWLRRNVSGCEMRRIGICMDNTGDTEEFRKRIDEVIIANSAIHRNPAQPGKDTP